MNPALSVIFFTTLSGAGLGLLVLVAIDVLRAARLTEVAGLLGIPLVCGFVLLAVGLLSSMFHLGKPLRAWRAFSQWRSSWLSREGVASVMTLAIAFALFVLPWLPIGSGALGSISHVLAAALILAAAVTLLCTSRIYDTIKAVPAWHHGDVLPNYVAVAAITALCWSSVLQDRPPLWGVWLVLASVLGLIAKLAHWRRIDRGAMPTNVGSLTGLDRFGAVRAFEAPHTESNFLLREMGFVLARKHARRLRALTILTLYVVPIAASLTLSKESAWSLNALVLGVATLGAFFERWLFFAEAKHVVTLYYPAPRQTAM